jgi:GNAT superfamily N-acetyltransferase
MWLVDVTYLCTTPSYAGQGAASALLWRVQELAAADSMSVVLESTMNAVSFYQRLGFAIEQGLDMMLPKRGSNEPTELYEEKCMVWRPAGGEDGQ